MKTTITIFFSLSIFFIGCENFVGSKNEQSMSSKPTPSEIDSSRIYNHEFKNQASKAAKSKPAELK